MVAGLNYKLTIAILKKNNGNSNSNSNNKIPTVSCLGAMKVVVYKPLPHTGLPLSVTSWGGRALSCEEVKDLLMMDHEEKDGIQQQQEEDELELEGEEEVATRVEEEIQDETEEVEPDA